MYLEGYIDTVRTTIAILKDWKERQWKLEHAPEMIEAIDTQLTNITSHVGATPVSGGGNRVDEGLVNGISRKDIAMVGYNQAEGAEREFSVAWESLTEDERFILTNRFVDNDDRQGIQRIMNRMRVEKSQAYELSEQALRKLSRRLFWR